MEEPGTHSYTMAVRKADCKEAVALLGNSPMAALGRMALRVRDAVKEQGSE